MNYLKFSLFGSLKGTESKVVSVDEIIRLIKHDDSVAQKTDLYRQMAQNVSRETAKKEIKEKVMPAFSVGVVFKSYGRKLSDVEHATGLALCDLDKIDDVRCKMDDVRARICQDPHTFLCYRTISGEGFRILYRFVREDNRHLNCEVYPAAFKKGNDYFQELTGCEYDKACRDVVRLSGLAHDAEVYYNPDSEAFVITDEEFLTESLSNAPSEPGRPRKMYEVDSQHATPEEAWQRVQQMLTQWGMSYTPGSRHDYILHAAGLFNRFGADQDALCEWAAQEWGDLSEKERRDVISFCYRRKEEHGIWRLAQSSGKGRKNALLSTTEIRSWLSERCQVCYNVVTDQTMYKRSMVQNLTGGQSLCETSLTWGQSPCEVEYELIDERVVESMRCQMEADTRKRVLTKDVLSVLNSDFSVLIHPIRDYIHQLSPWDGKDRVHELATHLVAEPVIDGQSPEEAQQDIEWALHKWLVAMVATWMDDKQANHQVFTLIGEQGIYKSTFFRHLLPQPLRGYSWENAHNSFAAKDDKLAIAENCLVEIEEIEAIEGRQMAELKALVTAESINERRPYALFRKLKPRLASFCASGNEQRFLTDQTGNRRWLCFKVSHIDDPRQWNMDYEQLYAQLREENQQGFQFWFDKQEEKKVERLNEPFRLISTEEQLIGARLRKPFKNEKPQYMSAAMISVFIGGGHLSSLISTRKVGTVMRKMGFSWTHRMDGDYFKVIEIPYQDVQNYLGSSKTTDAETSKLADNEQFALPF